MGHRYFIARFGPTRLISLWLYPSSNLQVHNATELDLIGQGLTRPWLVQCPYGTFSLFPFPPSISLPSLCSCSMSRLWGPIFHIQLHIYGLREREILSSPYTNGSGQSHADKRFLVRAFLVKNHSLWWRYCTKIQIIRYSLWSMLVIRHTGIVVYLSEKKWRAISFWGTRKCWCSRYTQNVHVTKTTTKWD